MATIPIKSLFGKILGLSRASSTYPTERLVVPGGIITQAVYMSTAAGSETAVNIQGFTDIEASSTATDALATRGITFLSNGATTRYTMAAPPAAGIRRTIATQGTTALRQILSAAVIVTGNSSTAACGADGGSLVASTSMTLMSFNGAGQVIELISLSTSAWINSSLRGFTTTMNQPLSS